MCYVGQSSRHLQTRIREHTKNPGPVKTHLRNCNTTITEEHIDILTSTSRGGGIFVDSRGFVYTGVGTKDKH